MAVYTRYSAAGTAAGDSFVIAGESAWKGFMNKAVNASSGVDVFQVNDYAHELRNFSVSVSSSGIAIVSTASTKVYLAGFEKIVYNGVVKWEASTYTGTAAADTIIAGPANNTIIGGLGGDTITGGAGKDIFKLNTVADSAIGTTTRDVITDFTRGQDKIDLSAIDAKTGGTANDAFKLIAASALTAANANGAVWFANGVLNASTDADTAAEIQIQLTGVSAFGTADIIL